MKINNEEVNIENLVTEDLHTNFHSKYGNDIYLTDNEKTILERYDFNIDNYSNINDLIFDITEYVDDNYELGLDDLEDVLDTLTEFNYYYNTNK